MVASISASLHVFAALLAQHPLFPRLKQEDDAGPQLPVTGYLCARHLHPKLIKSQVQVLEGRLWSATHRQGTSPGPVSCDWEGGKGDANMDQGPFSVGRRKLVLREKESLEAEKMPPIKLLI